MLRPFQMLTHTQMQRSHIRGGIIAQAAATTMCWLMAATMTMGHLATEAPTAMSCLAVVATMMGWFAAAAVVMTGGPTGSLAREQIFTAAGIFDMARAFCWGQLQLLGRQRS